MHISHFLTLALPLTLAPAALAQTWTENGEAGKLPASAQVVAGAGALTQINGNFNDPSEPLGIGNDKDMFRICITDPSSFTATTVGGTTADTQMFLFNEAGLGVAFNDDQTGLQSGLTNLFVTTPGVYLLAVSTYNRDATSAGGLIWLNSPFNTERAPDGPGAASPITGWTGESATAVTAAAYSIFLTGCSFCPVASFEIYPGVTSFTSRGNIAGAASGEVHQGFHGSHWGCIGDSGSASSIIGVTYLTQDQNALTPELYDLVVRSGTDSAGPTPGAPGELSTIVGLTTPSGAATGAAWFITADFATPCAIPEKGFFSAGLGLGINPLWPADGQSVHASSTQLTQQSGPHQGDHAWQILTGPVVSHPSGGRSWRIAPRVLTPILQNGVFATGGTAYSRGMGGMFPPMTTHGWSTHITAGSKYAGGFAATFLSTGQLASTVQLGGFGGSLCIDPATLVPLPLLPLDGSGNLSVGIMDPVGGPFGLATVYLQAVVVSTNFDLHFTNMNGSTFQ